MVKLCLSRLQFYQEFLDLKKGGTNVNLDDSGVTLKNRIHVMKGFVRPRDQWSTLAKMRQDYASPDSFFKTNFLKTLTLRRSVVQKKSQLYHKSCGQIYLQVKSRNWSC